MEEYWQRLHDCHLKVCLWPAEPEISAAMHSLESHTRTHTALLYCRTDPEHKIIFIFAHIKHTFLCVINCSCADVESLTWSFWMVSWYVLHEINMQNNTSAADTAGGLHLFKPNVCIFYIISCRFNEIVLWNVHVFYHRFLNLTDYSSTQLKDCFLLILQHIKEDSPEPYRFQRFFFCKPVQCVISRNSQRVV